MKRLSFTLIYIVLQTAAIAQNNTPTPLFAIDKMFLYLGCGINFNHKLPVIFDNKRFNPYFKAGIGYKINEKLEISTGVGYDQNATDFTYSVGSKEKQKFAIFFFPIFGEFRYTFAETSMKPSLFSQVGVMGTSSDYYENDKLVSNGKFISFGMGSCLYLAQNLMLNIDLKYWVSDFSTNFQVNGSNFDLLIPEKKTYLRNGLLLTFRIYVFVDKN